MTSISVRPTTGWLVAALIMLISVLSGRYQSAQAYSYCEDFGGTPDVVVLPGDLPGTFIIDGSTTYTIHLPAAQITDLDVALRIKTNNVSNLIISLHHVIQQESGNNDVKSIYLSFADGCSLGSGYPAGTIKTQDMAVYLDDQAQASITTACDRTIPSLAGRLQPTNAAYPPKNDVFLSTFNGRQAGFGNWELVIENRTSVPQQIEVADICFIVNGTLEGDVAPRENTPGINPNFSANGILTISDYIDSALFLLGFNSIDNRIFDTPSTTPLPFDLGSIGDLNLRMSLLESSTAEYPRLDCAPASSGGNGAITVADWVQATRYASGVGFDTPVGTAGPLSEFDRVIRVGQRNQRILIERNRPEVAVPIIMRSKGVEREVGFGLQFDQNLLEFVRVERGAAVPANAIFQLNNEVGGQPNVIGLQIGLLPGQTFPTTLDGTTPTDFTQNIDADVELAKFYFRAKPGSGATATELTFLQNPLIFPAPGARNPGGALQYTSFASGEVTIINNSDARPRVRVVDTVLASGGQGDVQIALDAVGIENSLGFTLNFNPAELTLLSASRGRDLPFEGFFFTEPDYVLDIASANTDGQLRILAGLQPGKTFPQGTNLVVNLRFQAASVGSTIASNLTFTKLYDTREVTDARAIPLVADFPDGTVRISDPTCSYILTPSSANFTTDGGSGVFDVDTTSGCPWIATTGANWISIINQAVFSDDASVNFTVSPNNSPDSRSGTILVGGQAFTVTQDGCVYTLNPSSAQFSQFGGTGSFDVRTTGACPWEAIANNTWIHITSDGFGQGDGTITYSVDNNLGIARVGTISVQDQVFTITQSVCSYNVAPTAFGPLPPSATTGLNVNLTTTGICPWTAVSNAPWIVIQSAPSGSGSTTVTFDVQANTGASRNGSITVAGQAVTVSQSGVSDCNYSVAPPSLTFSGQGGNGSFGLTTTAGCPWDVVVSDSWITVTNAAGDTTAPFAGIGSGTIDYAVAPNSGLARTGTITVGAQVHTVTQFGGNEFVFEFRNDPEGWTFQTVTPAFTAPTGAWDAGSAQLPGRLDITATDNTNTFGFWGSPSLSLVTPASASSLYKADFVVSRNTVSQSDVPAFRLRTSSADFSQSDVMVVSSTGNGNLSPVEIGKAYRHLFTLPAGTSTFRAFFDMLNFDPTDSATGRISLESIILAPVDPAKLTNPTLVRQFLLSSSTAGWSPVTAPPFTAPVFSVDARGLTIASNFTGSGAPPATIGFWTNETDVTLTANKVYRASFTVSSRTEGSTSVRKDLVPAFRLRANDSSFKLSNYVNIESISESSRVPTFLVSQTYDVWFQAPGEVGSNSLFLAFDYLLVPESNNDPRISVTLESVIITSYDLAP